MKNSKVPVDVRVLFISILLIILGILGVQIDKSREKKAAAESYKSFGVLDSKIDSVSYPISDSLAAIWTERIEQLDRKVWKLQTLYPNFDLKEMIRDNVTDLYLLPSPENILKKNRTEDDIEFNAKFSKKHLEFDEQMRTRYREYKDGKKVDVGCSANKDRLYRTWVHVEFYYNSAKKSYYVRGKMILNDYVMNISLPKDKVLQMLSSKYEEISIYIDDISKLLKIK
jgi:hypothetical protein